MTAAPIVLLVALSARTVTLAEAERAAEVQKPEVRVAQANTAAGAARTEQARAAMKEAEISVRVRLGDGPGASRAYGCDLSYEYVRINGEYTT